ncbi:MAG: YicC family protein [Rhizobiales bacterium]|nr:YicC family protein [Hyphomicrobiales bacterium]
MPINSMTGFSRADGALGSVSWHWELKSVNGRGLDVRCRMPQGLEALEQKVRAAVSASLARGNCQISLNLVREQDGRAIKINHDVLDALVTAAEGLKDKIDASPPTLDGLLAIKGVVEVAEPEETEADRQALTTALLVSLEAALKDLAGARAEEGSKLHDLLSGQINQIEDLTEQARQSPARTPDMIMARLTDQVAKLVENSSALDPDRLHQEAVMLAAKADIQEELDRLDAHVTAARDLMAGAGPHGRKLDFLTQEFNREANTLCSKANDTSVTSIGLEMKAVIDQMKEQVQNIE